MVAYLYFLYQDLGAKWPTNIGLCSRPYLSILLIDKRVQVNNSIPNSNTSTVELRIESVLLSPTQKLNKCLLARFFRLSCVLHDVVCRTMPIAGLPSDAAMKWERLPSITTQELERREQQRITGIIACMLFQASKCRSLPLFAPRRC